MSDSTRGQVARSAAEVYDAFFVPALFEEWPPRLARAAGLRPGQRVLDVACGTGVLARHAARVVGAGGEVVGLDLNPGMLEVARRRAPGASWREGTAEALPFADARFDAVLSQFGLMFFADRAGALREMWRVLRPGGALAVAVWARLEDTPGYAALARLLRRVLDAEAAAALEAPFSLGARAALEALAGEAGIAGARVETHEGTTRFASLHDWLFTEVRGWTLSERIDDAQFARLEREAEAELGGFVAADGTVSFASPAHVMSAAKP